MKAIKKPTQAALAAALGVDPAVITRDKRRGMPVHSIEAAQQWRLETLRVRYTPERDHLAVHRAIDGEIAARRATDLMQAAAELLQSGGNTQPLLDPLRATMAAVPPSQRGRVGLHFEVMDLLTSGVAKVLDQGDPHGLIEGTLYETVRDDGEGIDMGAFWYAVAAGEIHLRRLPG